MLEIENRTEKIREQAERLAKSRKIEREKYTKDKELLKKALKEIIKSLKSTREKYNKKLLKNKEKDKDELELYKTEDDVQEAYGWAAITEKQRDTLIEQIKNQDEKIYLEDVVLWLLNNEIQDFVEEMKEV